MSESLSGLSIQRMSTADQVAGLMRERILRGELKPGTALREVTIAAAIGVSRNTLREALRILTQEGLVRHTVHHGMTVTKLSPESVGAIYRVRGLLEAAAVVTGRPTEEHLDLLAAAVERLDTASKRRDWPALVEADMQFHRAIVGMVGSARLDAFYGNLLSELRIGLVAVDRASTDLQQMSREHGRFYRLLKVGRREECARLLQAHLKEAERRLKAVIASDRGPED